MLVVPSPWSQVAATTVPSRSLDGEASRDARRSSVATSKAAVGGTFGAIAVTVRVVVAVAPRSSVTVSVTG